MKTSRLEIFVDFFSPELDALVDADVGEGGVVATPVAVPVRDGSEVAVAALVGGLVGGGSAVSAAVEVVESLPAMKVGLCV